MAKPTLAVKCNCKNSFQDQTYGKDVRAASSTLKGTARCSSCGHEHHNYTGDFEQRRKGGGINNRRTYYAYPPEGGWVGGPPEKNGYKG